MYPLNVDNLLQRVKDTDAIPIYGKIVNVVGLAIEATGPRTKVGDLCYIVQDETNNRVPAEVVGFRGDRILLMPLGEMRGLGPGSLLIPTSTPLRIAAGNHLIGRVIGGLGEAIDGGPAFESTADPVDIVAPAPAPLDRRRILEPLSTGIRAIDACVTCGKGQRIGILSGSGVGKSKLLGMIARNTNADVNVIALIGERGREVRDFIEVDLAEEGLRRSVIVVATSDQPALLRIKAAHLATAIAEWFRDQGDDVMFMMDSATRFAMAQREVGLAIGEPPTTKGYPPSVFAAMPRLFERAGATEKGSITGFYTVLVEADDFNDPIGDAVRSVLDGHIILSRDLASRGQYPAVDILESISRVMIDVVSDEHQDLANTMRRVLATYRDAEDLINIGAYVQGSNSEIDTAMRLLPKIRAFLEQGLFEPSSLDGLTDIMKETIQ